MALRAGFEVLDMALTPLSPLGSCADNSPALHDWLADALGQRQRSLKQAEERHQSQEMSLERGQLSPLTRSYCFIAFSQWIVFMKTST